MNELKKTVQLPPQWSTIAPEIDWLYYFLFWISVAFFVAIVGAMIFFVLKYRRRPGVEAKPTGHSNLLEVVWTVLPVFLLVYLFHQGFGGYVQGRIAPDDAIEIRVTAKQWSWEFEHPNGFVENNELHIPANKPIKMLMSSQDVIHSFFVPAFRVKRDVVPGMFTTAWFEATNTTPTTSCEQDSDCGDGLYCAGADDEKACALPLFCTEYCGAGDNTSTTPNSNHSSMMAAVTVMPQTDYDQLMKVGKAKPTGVSYAEWGQKIAGKVGCGACHSVDGSKMTGPTWKGLPGSNRNFADGTERIADINYVAQSIREPGSQIVKGFENAAMSPYRLSDNEIKAIFEYMKSLDPSTAGAGDAEPAAEAKDADAKADAPAEEKNAEAAADKAEEKPADAAPAGEKE